MNFMNKLKFNVFLITKNISFTVQFFASTKSPHVPLRGKVGQLRKRTRVFCLSIYIICVCVPPMFAELFFITVIVPVCSIDQIYISTCIFIDINYNAFFVMHCLF